jgi:hypothetical protein
MKSWTDDLDKSKMTIAPKISARLKSNFQFAFQARGKVIPEFGIPDATAYSRRNKRISRKSADRNSMFA